MLNAQQETSMNCFVNCGWNNLLQLGNETGLQALERNDHRKFCAQPATLIDLEGKWAWGLLNGTLPLPG